MPGRLLSGVAEVGGAGEKVGEGEAGAEGADEVGEVVAFDDVGEDVFGGVDRHGGFKQAGVAFERVINTDVFQARIQNCGMEEN